MQERDTVWQVLKIAADIGGSLEKAQIRNADFSGLQQTIYVTRSTIGSFLKTRPVDPAFDMCLHSLQTSLVKCKRLLHTVLGTRKHKRGGSAHSSAKKQDGGESSGGAGSGASSSKSSSNKKASSSGGKEGQSRKAAMRLFKLDFLIKQKIDQFDFLFLKDQSGLPASRLSHPAVRKFWIESFGSQVSMVPWQEFWLVFRDLSRFDESTHDSQAQAKISQYVDFVLDGWVSTYELEIFIKSFGPPKGCLDRLLDALNTGILGGYIPASEANTLLSAEKPGSFVVRFSKSKPGSFAVTFVDNKNRIKHCLLYSATPHGVTLRHPPDVYPTLLDFVKAHSKKLKYAKGALAHKGITELVEDGILPEGVLETAFLKSLGESVATTANYNYSLPDYALDSAQGNSCSVCMDGAVNCCLLPCRHCCVCMDCAMILKSCPLCRNPIVDRMQVYL